MRSFLSTIALAVVPCTAVAQVSEVPGMTVPHSFVDMDVVGPAGPTTLAAIIAAGTNGGAPLTGITLTPSTAVTGLYNTNPSLGRALAYDAAANRLLLVDPPAGVYDAFNARIDLALPSTEFGIAIGDYINRMVLDFYFQNTLLGSVTSTAYANPDARFFQSTGGPFDRVDVRASTAAGNWVIPELYIQNAVAWAPFGAGCTGSNGVPRLFNANNPQVGSLFVLNTTNMPVAGGLYGIVFGFSTTNFPGLGPLPFDLAPFGAPGCNVLCDILSVTLGTQTNGSAAFTLPIPNNVRLRGITFANQGYVFDAGANAGGITTTNGGLGTVQ